MRRMGICSKCGKETIVQDHHIKGYGGEHKDEVVPYCISCDLKAHYKAKREGRCTLTGKESYKLSTISSQKRYDKMFNRTINLSHNTVGTNVQLHELILINIKTGNISFGTYFQGTNRKKLKIIDEK